MQTSSSVVGKASLAKELGWSRPTLDKRLKTDARFPVRRRGDQSGGWEFDLVDVRRYLDGGTRSSPPAIDTKQLADAVRPPQPVTVAKANGQVHRRAGEDRGEATARQRKDEAQAQILEIKAGKERERYVEADDVRRTLELMLTHLGNALNGVPDAVVKLFGLPAEAEATLREMMDDLRINMKKDLERFLADE